MAASAIRSWPDSKWPPLRLPGLFAHSNFWRGRKCDFVRRSGPSSITLEGLTNWQFRRL